ncbi:hypothetical protein RCL1_003008 [Eukaryota sp. TZLM3-RCL]
MNEVHNKLTQLASKDKLTASEYVQLEKLLQNLCTLLSCHHDSLTIGIKVSIISIALTILQKHKSESVVLLILNTVSICSSSSIPVQLNAAYISLLLEILKTNDYSTSFSIDLVNSICKTFNLLCVEEKSFVLPGVLSTLIQFLVSNFMTKLDSKRNLLISIINFISNDIITLLIDDNSEMKFPKSYKSLEIFSTKFSDVLSSKTTTGSKNSYKILDWKYAASDRLIPLFFKFLITIVNKDFYNLDLNFALINSLLDFNCKLIETVFAPLRLLGLLGFLLISSKSAIKSVNQFDFRSGFASLSDLLNFVSHHLILFLFAPGHSLFPTFFPTSINLLELKSVVNSKVLFNLITVVLLFSPASCFELFLIDDPDTKDQSKLIDKVIDIFTLNLDPSTQSMAHSINFDCSSSVFDLFVDTEFSSSSYSFVKVLSQNLSQNSLELFSNFCLKILNISSDFVFVFFCAAVCDSSVFSQNQSFLIELSDRLCQILSSSINLISQNFENFNILLADKYREINRCCFYIFASSNLLKIASKVSSFNFLFIDYFFNVLDCFSFNNNSLEIFAQYFFNEIVKSRQSNLIDFLYENLDLIIDGAVTNLRSENSRLGSEFSAGLFKLVLNSYSEKETIQKFIPFVLSFANEILTVLPQKSFYNHRVPLLKSIYFCLKPFYQKSIKIDWRALEDVENPSQLQILLKMIIHGIVFVLDSPSVKEKILASDILFIAFSTLSNFPLEILNLIAVVFPPLLPLITEYSAPNLIVKSLNLIELFLEICDTFVLAGERDVQLLSTINQLVVNFDLLSNHQTIKSTIKTSVNSIISLILSYSSQLDLGKLQSILIDLSNSNIIETLTKSSIVSLFN